MSSPAGQRTCIGCRRIGDRTALVRVVLSEPAAGAAPRVVADPTRSAPGRGAWLHPQRDCLDRAEKTRAFARAFRRAVDAEPLISRWEQLPDVVTRDRTADDDGRRRRRLPSESE